jgi:hypothetical protein
VRVAHRIADKDRHKFPIVHPAHGSANQQGLVRSFGLHTHNHVVGGAPAMRSV